MKTKRAFAQEARDKYWTQVQGADINALAKWSTDVHEKVHQLETDLVVLKDAAKMAEAERSKARLVYRKDSNMETLSQWHESVARLKACNEELKSKRMEKNEVQALSEILSKEIKIRREKNSSASPSVVGQEPVGRKKRRRDATHDTSMVHTAVIEPCPFCSHWYTVRDGTYPKLDAMGEPMQLWKCQCREMEPPCRNCPKCKENPEIMALHVDEQLSICREKEACEICSCECPGGGKWIQGDEKSREKYRKKAIERHQKLSGISEPNDDGGSDEDVPKRLPAYLKNQLEAAQALLKVQATEDDKDCQSNRCVGCANHH